MRLFAAKQLLGVAGEVHLGKSTAHTRNTKMKFLRLFIALTLTPIVLLYIISNGILIVLNAGNLLEAALGIVLAVSPFSATLAYLLSRGE